MKTSEHTPADRSRFFRAFVDHPASVNETYFEHALFAGRFSLVLFAAGTAALIHAIIPYLFESTASRMIANLHAMMQARH